jgi:hypothetical protein
MYAAKRLIFTTRKGKPMQQEAYADYAVQVPQDSASDPISARNKAYFRISGIALTSGALVTTLFNILFPRVADPWDTIAVLMMMAENETLRQISFLGITAGIWSITAGAAGISHTISRDSGAFWARIGFYFLLAGAAIFTTANALGLAATNAAVDWAAAGADPASAQYAIAASLNAADDSVWYLAIITFWGALAVIGAGMYLSEEYPRWMGGAIMLTGTANALLIGLPLSFGVTNPALFLGFAGLAQLTIIWALVSGIWMLRRSR